MVIVVWTLDAEIDGEECRRIISMRKANGREQARYLQRLAKVDAHEIQPDEYNEIPELTDEWFDKADLHVGDTLIRRERGRPPLDAPKKLVSLRLDQEVIDRFRAGGPGWQSRINAALRKHLWGE
jgi:uncharacterized protein (DUF4415 family)